MWSLLLLIVSLNFIKSNIQLSESELVYSKNSINLTCLKSKGLCDKGLKALNQMNYITESILLKVSYECNQTEVKKPTFSGMMKCLNPNAYSTGSDEDNVEKIKTQRRYTECKFDDILSILSDQNTTCSNNLSNYKNPSDELKEIICTSFANNSTDCFSFEKLNYCQMVTLTDYCSEYLTPEE